MEQNTETKKHKRDYLLPASILFAAVLIAGALFYNAGMKQNQQRQVADLAESVAANQPEQLAKNVKPITAQDHKIGPDNAPIKIITFTDLECPYCKEFHNIMMKTIKNMPGQIQYVMRNFPLDMHAKAKPEAIATECAANIGGEDMFFKFVDKVFAATKSNDGLDLNLLPKFATDLGIDKNKFAECLKSDKFNDLIKTNLEDGASAGLQGTPYSVVIAPNGQYIPLNGLIPLEKFEVALKNILEQK